MNEPLSSTTAFIIGLLSAVHCIGMCGGIMSALSLAIPPEQRRRGRVIVMIISYNLGRITSYTIAGALVGGLGSALLNTYAGAAMALRVGAGLMLIAMGLYLGNWWHGLTRLERAGAVFWRILQPLGKRFTPATHPMRTFLLGMVWGWLPCGLVYTQLTWAATAANWEQSAIIMLSFGAGTLPAMILTGSFARELNQIIRAKSTRVVAALSVMLFGVWTIIAAVQHHGHMDHQSSLLLESPHSHHQ